MRALTTAFLSSILVAGCGGSTTTPTGATSPGSAGTSGSGGGGIGVGGIGVGGGGGGIGVGGIGVGGGTGIGVGGGTGIGVGGGTGIGVGGGSGSGSGGGGSGGSSGSGSSGSSGGSTAIACAKLGPPDLLTLQGDPQWSQRRPRLAQLKNGSVLLAVGYDAVESPGPVDSPFASLAFPAWGAWPSVLGPAAIGFYSGGTDFRVAHDNCPDCFATLYRYDPVSPPFVPPTGLMSAFEIQAGGMLTQDLVDPTQPAPPLFLARGAQTLGDAGHLWGWSWELPLNSLHYAVRVGWSVPGGTTDGFACGTSPVFADAVPSGQGFLVAASSSAPFGTCGKGGNPGPDGPPNRLQLSRFEEGVATFGDEIVDFGPLLAVAIAPRADGGAWVVWLPTGDPAAAPPKAQRVDASGKLVGVPFVPGMPGESGTYAIGSLGNALVFSQLLTLDPSAPSIAITIHGDAGPITAASFQPPGGHFAAPDLSVLGSPSDDAVLVAWSDAPPTNTPYSVHVARMSCLP